ncbi:transcriptional regulator [Pseudomonas sp. FW305-67]|nr:transcriptional regulator [Pseudomonas sp. FW305-53]PMY86606.1 transcriptional regulator [Pseudomonas sp. FW303-C2]PMY94543.1 transcriptional regulator [Pseudomonas sp. FW305-62]PNA45284.1 transcriptional regulator [Pseudomonas sp. FW306-2-2C-A10BC]PNA80745.1 transcriptional regulator [Pseudomonas sp. MPR-R3B]PNB23486.1 transcriptional regulator [Pseudomonas sp. FW305-67]
MLAADGLHTDLGHLAHLLRPPGGRNTPTGLRASLFCFD